MDTKDSRLTYFGNRLEMLNTKHQGNVITAVKDAHTAERVEREIMQRLQDYGGENADFFYWWKGEAYIANFTLTSLRAHYGNGIELSFESPKHVNRGELIKLFAAEAFKRKAMIPRKELKITFEFVATDEVNKQLLDTIRIALNHANYGFDLLTREEAKA